MKSGLAVHLNDLPEPQARAVLGKCCGAPRWVARMLAARPFADDAAVHTVAEPPNQTNESMAGKSMVWLANAIVNDWTTSGAAV